MSSKDFWLKNHWVGNKKSSSYEENKNQNSERWDSRIGEDQGDRPPIANEQPQQPQQSFQPYDLQAAMNGQNQKADGGAIDPKLPKGVKPNDFAVQYSRQGARPNYDEQGNQTSHSTHKMGTFISDEGNYAFPTLFQNKDDSWVDPSEKDYKGKSAFWEAKSRGELYEFDTPEEAEKFSHGSWKPAYERYAQGGLIESQDNQSGLNRYDAGGTHEQNPYGGIPQGVGSNGKMNTVEQGETSFKFGKQKFIFSDRIKIK